MFKFELGQVLKDIITGFEGVAVARTQYHTGCVRYSLQSQKLTKEGATKTWDDFDEITLVATKKKSICLAKKEVKIKKPGGPQQPISRW